MSSENNERRSFDRDESERRMQRVRERIHIVVKYALANKTARIESLGGIAWAMLDTILDELRDSTQRGDVDLTVTAVRELLTLNLNEFEKSVAELQLAPTADCRPKQSPFKPHLN